MSAVAGAPDPRRRSTRSPPRLAAAGALLEQRRDAARQRQRVIAANTELQERELIKLATLAVALADALRRRGVADPAASLTAEAGIAVFKIAFERWIGESNQRDLPQVIREVARRAQGRARRELIAVPPAGRLAIRPLRWVGQPPRGCSSRLGRLRMGLR